MHVNIFLVTSSHGYTLVVSTNSTLPQCINLEVCVLLNFTGISVVVTESGWPWLGGSNEPDANAENAETYINNLIRRVLNDSGPPSHPTFPINTYSYELFNEDKRPGPVSERNWGVLFTNGSAVYPLTLSSSYPSGNSSGIFCVAKTDADPEKLQDALNWACGQGQADCTPIQQGHVCYLLDTLVNHASYAYNDYYQRMQSVGGTCDFDGTAKTTNVDPSYESCNLLEVLIQVQSGDLHQSRQLHLQVLLEAGVLISKSPGCSISYRQHFFHCCCCFDLRFHLVCGPVVKAAHFR